MVMHVKKGFDPKVTTSAGTLCGMAPQYATAGYNGECELVYRLDTGQVVDQRNVCPTCFSKLQDYKRQHKRPILP